MEESVWLYFGVIAAIISIGIVASIFSNYQTDNDVQMLFTGTQHLAKEVEIVCKAPRNTMLSVKVRIPSGSLLYAETDKVCAQYDDKIKCVKTDCPITEKVLVNVTSDEAKALFRSHDYECQVLHDTNLEITCQG